jgi:hypothetical protein
MAGIMRSQDITKGYYWVKFYNHEEKQIMLFNGKNFEGFKSDRFIHDEIESYKPIERGKNSDMDERQSNIPDVSDIIKCDDCGGELYYDETNKYYVCKECKTTQ